MASQRVPPPRLPPRLWAVYEVIRSGEYPNAMSLARQLEVAPRTIKRDVDRLRDLHGLAIRYNKVRHGYHLEDPAHDLPGGRFTEAELMAMFVARQALAACRGSAVERILSEGFRRLEQRLDQDQQYLLGDLGGLVSFQEPASDDLDLATFQALTQALRDRVEVRFEYRGLADAKPLPRRVRGYHLGCIDHKWYLFGWDMGRKALRTFALSRMGRLRVTHATFRKPPHFNLAEMLKGALTVHSGKPGREEVVRLRLGGWAARVASERRWHPTQEVRPLGGGLVEIELRLSGLEEVFRWIMSWGEQVEVLEPAELRERVRREAAAMTSRHASADR